MRSSRHNPDRSTRGPWWLPLIIACWMLTGAATSARADGKVFPTAQMPQAVTMPDQRALLAWKDGVETLVIESAFVGQGTEFAWVVPFPTKPEVFAATRGTLPAAVALMQPVVAEPIADVWAFVVIIGGIGASGLAYGWSVVAKSLRLVVLVAVVTILATIAGSLTGYPGVGLGVFLMGCAALYSLRARIQIDAVMVVLLVFVLLAAMSMPSFSKVRGMADDAPGSDAGVTVERHMVGDFDVAVLWGREDGGVIAWLEANGFALDAAARAVVAEQAAAGGWFAASRVRRDFAESGRSVPAPLAFRFATEAAMYPMRLTGAGATRPLEVELLVFGPGHAATEGLATKSVAALRYADAEPMAGRRSLLQPRDARRISHPELRRWTEGAPTATWLRGSLAPEQMRRDMAITWQTDANPSGLYAHARDDALARGALAAAVVVFGGALGLGLVFGGGPPPARWSAGVGFGALASGVLVLATTPTVATTSASGGLRSYMQRQLTNAMFQALLDLKPTAPDQEVRSAFAHAIEELSKSYSRPVSIGDAPGEVDLTKLPDGSWRVLFYDAYGQPRHLDGYDVPPGGPPEATPTATL